LLDYPLHVGEPIKIPLKWLLFENDCRKD